MDSDSSSEIDLKAKIARLVQERGWNQEDFARRAGLNRQTVRDILVGGTRRLRNTTLSTCARTLGLSVSELRDVPLASLLMRIGGDGEERPQPTTHRQYEQTMQPELLAWLERNPERARRLSEEDMDELLSLQGTGGPLTAHGVEHFVELIDRRKKLIEMVEVVAGTRYLALLEEFVGLLYDKVQPYRGG